jgi:DNA polymerase III subunit gamma/tau
MEWYRKHRPTLIKNLIGQPDAVRTLKAMIKEGIPHAILLTGASGTGKTTTARILKEKLNCSDHDFNEINAADSRGIDTVRDIRGTMGLHPMQGESRVFLIDEIHKMTGDAQTALLKMLEDTPAHVYFILATSDPQKLLKTIITRCTEVRFIALPHLPMKALIEDVAKKENVTLTEELTDRIIECADGSARKALVLLQQVAGIEGEEDQLSAVLSNDAKREGIEIARLVMNKATKWAEVSKALKEVSEEPETVRRIILGYARTMMLGSEKFAARAYLVIVAFENPFYDSGAAGLARACWEVFSQK